MAKNSKTPSKPSQAERKSRGEVTTSRKTIRKTTAPYARKGGDDDDDDDRPRPPRSAGKPGTDGGEAEASPKAPAAAGEAASAKAGETAGARAGAVASAGPPPVTRSRESAAPESADEDVLTGLASTPVPDSPAEPVEAPPVPAPRTAPPPMEAAEFAELLAPDAVDPTWDPEAAAPPPGKAPPGDSRSFRRIHDGAEEFVLIYRFKSFLVTRAGRVGKMGAWSVVEYPGMAAAAHAYAQECSALRDQGYRDLR